MIKPRFSRECYASSSQSVLTFGAWGQQGWQFPGGLRLLEGNSGMDPGDSGYIRAE